MDRVKNSGRRGQMLGNFVEAKSDFDGSRENFRPEGPNSREFRRS